MSGHSKWSTIKRQKEVKDMARGKLFSRLTRAISLAAKTGGGPDPNSNYKLRVAIDAARQANMPAENIKRAVSKAASSGESLEEIVYEGFGPEGIAVIVEVATDNRNRTIQEIKNIFERSGGALAGPGAVMHNFEPKGFILVKKTSSVEDQILKSIDLGAEGVEETEDGLEIFVPPKELFNIKATLEKNGFRVLKTELIQSPTNFIQVQNPQKVAKILSFLENLEDHEDAQHVFANVDLPQ